MKKNTVLVSAILTLAFSTLACGFLRIGEDGNDETITGSGPVVEQNRDVSGISRVELATTGTLHIAMGDVTSLRIEAQDNLMEYIETDVRGGTLLIRTPPGIDLRSIRPIQFYLTVEKLDKVEVSSDGDIIAGNLESDSFSVRINSSGEVAIDSLDCSSLDVEISSSGDINISKFEAEKISVKISSSGNLKVSDGQLQEQRVNISSSGDYQAGDVASETADIDITSSGSATVRVSGRLSGRISSSGNIYYVGNPEVDVRMTSSGKTIQIGQ